jgi:outer membrane protein
MHRTLALVALLGAAAPTAARAVTLEEALAAARAGNPAAIAAGAERRAADARLAQAEAARLPSASLSGTLGAGRLDPQGYFGLSAQSVVPRAVQAQVEQPLWAGGRIAAGREAARAGVAAAKAGEALAQALLAADVVAAYAGTVAARDELALRRTQLAQMREIERQARLRFRAGEVPSTDVAQAESRRAEAEAGLAAAEGEAEAAAARLTALTGLRPDGSEVLPPAPGVPASQAEALAAALSTWPALAQAEAGVAGARAQLAAARADRHPQLGAFAEASSLRDQFFPDYAADQVVVGVRARWTFFDPGRRARAAEAGARTEVAQAQADGARRALEAEVAAVHARWRAAGRSVEASEARCRAAEEALRAIRLERRVGMKPQLAELDAEREALEAAVARTRAQAALLAAAWRLRILTEGNPATGG